MKAKYCTLPTAFLYSVGSDKVVPELTESFGDVNIGVDTGLEPSIFVRRSKNVFLLTEEQSRGISACFYAEEVVKFFMIFH